MDYAVLVGQIEFRFSEESPVRKHLRSLRRKRKKVFPSGGIIIAIVRKTLIDRNSGSKWDLSYFLDENK